ncbi:MAG: DUF998 domain-containing protein [Candidatus Thermoplasmatota archaeon]|nr:DUF998 domain-containing protein [Candidatus Thermoplasmatota archaeon]
MKKYTIAIRMLAGISGVLLPFIALAVLIGTLPYAPWFSWTENAISDLGIPEYGLLFFNYGLILIGFLLLVFSIGLNLHLKKERVGPTIFSLSGIYLMGVGIFPLPSASHVDLAGLFFIAFPLGFFVIGVRLFRRPDSMLKRIGFESLVVTAISAGSSVFLLFFSGIAIPEVFVLFPGFLWCARYGVYLLSERET